MGEDVVGGALPSDVPGLGRQGPSRVPWGQVFVGRVFWWTKGQCPPSLFLSDPPLELRAEITTVKAASFPASWGLDVTALETVLQW